jgi:hypothetical protein
MPFEACAFDLVLNRRGGFKAAEMHRILKARRRPRRLRQRSG